MARRPRPPSRGRPDPHDAATSWDARRPSLVTLTDRGRELLEAHRTSRARAAAGSSTQASSSAANSSHDAQLYRAYLRAPNGCRRDGARVQRVVLDYELKRDYQRFLQERNRERRRERARRRVVDREVAEWARRARSAGGRRTRPVPGRPDRIRAARRRREVEDVEVIDTALPGRPRRGEGARASRCYRDRHAASADADGRRRARPSDPRSRRGASRMTLRRARQRRGRRSASPSARPASWCT